MVDNKEKRQKIKASRRSGSTSCKSRSSDTKNLSEAATKAYNNLPAPSINDMVQYYEGDKYRLAYELTRQELGRSGTVEEYQRKYKSNLHNVNRYIKKERTPSNEVKEQFKSMYLPQSRKSLKVHIRGCVRVSNEYYYKDSTWKKPIVISAKNANSFIKLAQNDIEAGYRYLNGIYMKSGNSDSTFDWLDNTEIVMRF